MGSQNSYRLLEVFLDTFRCVDCSCIPARFWEKGLNKCKDLEAKGASPSLKKSST